MPGSLDPPSVPLAELPPVLLLAPLLPLLLPLLPLLPLLVSLLPDDPPRLDEVLPPLPPPRTEASLSAA
jgi:hypothetical protein